MKRLKNALAELGGDLELLGEPGDWQAFAVFAPEGFQWIETGSNGITRQCSNSAMSWKPEVASELIEMIGRGIEPASQDTIDAMGW